MRAFLITGLIAALCPFFAGADTVSDAGSASAGETGQLLKYNGEPLGPDTWPALLTFRQVQVLAFLVNDEKVRRPKGVRIPKYNEWNSPICFSARNKLRLDILAFGSSKELIELSCKARLLLDGKPYQSFPAYTCFSGHLPPDGVSVIAGDQMLAYRHDHDPDGKWTLHVDVTEKTSGRTQAVTTDYNGSPFPYLDCSRK